MMRKCWNRRGSIILFVFCIAILLQLSLREPYVVQAAVGKNAEEIMYVDEAAALIGKDDTEKLTPAVYAKRYQREALRLLNQYRKSHGVKKLSFSSKLQKAANLRAKEALKNPDLSHKRFNKKGKLCSFSSVYGDLNLHIRYRGTGENLAWRAYQASPEAAAKSMFQQWRESPAHRKNMLDWRYDTVAIGIAYDETGSRGYEYGASSAQLFICRKDSGKK